MGSRLLPAIIHGTSTVRMSELTGPPSIVLAVASAVAVAHGMRRRPGPERWLTVTVWVCCADLVLTFASLYRYSLGWYVGRVLTVLTASLVFLAMLGELVRLQRQLLVERGILVVEADTDPLTGLANRSALNDGLQRRFRYHAPDCLLLVALDRLDEVDDTFGTDAADAVLVETARRLVENTRAGDLVARLGGAEFALVLSGPFGEGELGRFVQRLVSALEHPHRIVLEGITERLTVTASLGLSLLCEHDEVADAVWTADNRLYRSRRERSVQSLLADVGSR
jgi:diguanylate cyclase (GGDEF)-like protein